uniref:Uncharacterized protein n=1 Tax=Arundo donax TaxID=35708 RepID=A0A0A9A0Y9_ARUDO
MEQPSILPSALSYHFYLLNPLLSSLSYVSSYILSALELSFEQLFSCTMHHFIVFVYVVDSK